MRPFCDPCITIRPLRYMFGRPKSDRRAPDLPGVNFINVLCVRFLYESKLSSFPLITFGFVIFGTNISNKKRARKMLMKLTPVEKHCSWTVFWMCTFVNGKWHDSQLELKLCNYRVFHRFGQAKFAFGGSILGSNQITLLPQVPLKMMLNSKVVKIDSKIIISIH